MYRRIMKILHEVGAVGVMGALAACIVLIVTAPRHSMAEYAAVRHGIVAITQWLLLPSLAVTLISGLLAIAANEGYINAGWPWLKAVTGISMFEGSLLTISASSRQAADLSAMAAAGQGDPGLLDQVLRTEWRGLWIILAVSFINIVLGVWRPRLVRRSPPA
jgi:uncharacterized membrane protein